MNTTTAPTSRSPGLGVRGRNSIKVCARLPLKRYIDPPSHELYHFHIFINHPLTHSHTLSPSAASPTGVHSTLVSSRPPPPFASPAISTKTSPSPPPLHPHHRPRRRRRSPPPHLPPPWCPAPTPTSHGTSPRSGRGTPPAGSGGDLRRSPSSVSRYDGSSRWTCISVTSPNSSTRLGRDLLGWRSSRRRLSVWSSRSNLCENSRSWDSRGA